ncbi:MAG: Haloacid dehalogenase-like hydrolase, partial [Candidatus Hydrogenedentes bacterium]|nr:Haloacid dehalogenase-like hydrolase [Candidatus Hydrogenedentota bacterium]
RGAIVTEKSLFQQNVIAIIWDFDKTLSPHYMQKPIFDEYGIDEGQFWREVNQLPDYYARSGVQVPRDTCYLGHLLSYVKAGRMPGLTNAKLRELGGKIEFFPGIPEIFDRLEAIVCEPQFASAGVCLEHYVVSTGLAELIRGSAISSWIAGIWASEFIECSAEPGQDLSGTPSSGPISQIAGFLDNTTKTRALFEINKGVNKESTITVNKRIAEDDRRVPFKNMIYIADGPSDIPSFSVVRKHGGHAFAVFARGSASQFEQANALLEDGRVDNVGPADYREHGQTDMWLQLQVRRLTERIVEERQRALESRVGREPVHAEALPESIP